MLPHFQQVDLQNLLDAETWRGRRDVWEDSDLGAFIVRGPTPRREFHINPGDEVFYQLEGELQLHYVAPHGERAVAALQAGQLFLMPANVPHSPRRPENSSTLVVERKRRAGEVDRWIWYCDECDAILHEVRRSAAEATDVVSPATEALRAEPQLRTCRRCGHLSAV